MNLLPARFLLTLRDWFNYRISHCVIIAFLMMMMMMMKMLGKLIELDELGESRELDELYQFD